MPNDLVCVKFHIGMPGFNCHRPQNIGRIVKTHDTGYDIAFPLITQGKLVCHFTMYVDKRNVQTH